MARPDLEAEIAAFKPDVPFRAVIGYRHSTWAKTWHSYPERFIQPETLEEIEKVVKLARKLQRRIVLTGCGHSPSDLTCTSSWLVNLDKYNRVLRVDPEGRTMLVEGGIRLHQLNQASKEHGLTMPNLGSIDEQSLTGAIATATHGSSMYYGLLSQSVRSLRIVLANGRAVRCSATQSSDLFRAALVSLGALGIIVEVEFEVAKDCNIEWVQTQHSMSYVLDNWSKDLWTSAEFTRVWWLPYLKRAIAWRADKTDKPTRAAKASWYGGELGYHTYHNLLWLSNYAPWILPWVEWFVYGMQHGFKLGPCGSAVEAQRDGLLLDCLYSQYVNEWAISISKGPEALERLGAWISGDDAKSGIPFPSKGIWVHAPIEVRISDTSKPASFNAAQPRPFLDNTVKTEPTLYLNATLYRPHLNDPAWRTRYYQAFEWLMRELGGKPHWAKNFQSVDRADVEEMYGEDLQSWRRVRDSVDPEGLFVGDWLRRVVLSAPKDEGGEMERLPIEERFVGARPNGTIGGRDWRGEQRSGIDTHAVDHGSSGSEAVLPIVSGQTALMSCTAPRRRRARC